MFYKFSKQTIIICIAFLCLTCSKERWFAKITYEGTVCYSRATMKPAPGIWVYLYACEPQSSSFQCKAFIVGQDLTDADGHFKIHDNAARSDKYGIQLVPDSLNSPIRGNLEITGEELKMASGTTLFLGEY